MGFSWPTLVWRRLANIDRWVQKVSKGRWALIGRVDNSLVLTTVGRRSGRARSSPLVYVRDQDALIIVGTNFGQRNHPSWSANLMAHPTATVLMKGRSFTVDAEPVIDEQARSHAWGLMTRHWSGYAAYAERSGREIRIFRLIPRKE
ncbi:nitroreductase family deazaflavin-dependent oxidoreductase [Streptosporangium jomthongense]|uniref:Nitroreductase family deazaflavin-dependent oxidoreductase n=1 Tax=Streptosporangium jomthongense TaxID=1193683 RepID=A0ABV8FCZ3_9ACTN